MQELEDRIEHIQIVKEIAHTILEHADQIEAIVVSANLFNTANEDSILYAKSGPTMARLGLVEWLSTKSSIELMEKLSGPGE